MFYYWAFGLSIYSEIEFPELYPTSEVSFPDVNILFGPVPSEINVENGFRSDYLSIEQESFLLHVKDVASYFVEEGSRITISIIEHAPINEVRLFCLSNAFAALLHQRELIPLHAAGFLFEGKVVMLMGSSGVGKSTTLAAMMKKGYAPFSDDICVPIKNGTGDWTAYSSYPMLKYWEETLNKFDIPESAKKVRLRSELNKYGVFFHDKFTCNPHKIKTLILLEEDQHVGEVSIKKITGIEAFVRLQAEAYRREFLEYENMTQSHFRVLSSMANELPVFSLTRPSKKESHDEVVGIIESIL